MKNNPLQQYFRKPSMYVSLPSGGIFNPEIDKSAVDDIGILPMTALDEIALKNPDALLNGEALTDLIKSCVPAVVDPSKLCNIDAEALYLAIRYATYGKDITYSHKCPECEEVNDFNIDINFLLDRFPDFNGAPTVEYDDLTLHIRPPTVRSYTKLALIELEQTKAISDIRDSVVETKDEATEEEQNHIVKKFYDSFTKIANHNIDMVADTIFQVETPSGIVDDPEFINDFIHNVPGSVVEEINEKIKNISTRPDDITKFNFTCPNCNTESEINLEVNPVNFSEAG